MEFKKFIVPVAFITLFLIITWLFSTVFSNVIMANYQLKRQDTEFYSSHSDLQYLIMGDSHSGAGLNPDIIENAYNFASPGENYIQTYYKLKYVLNNGSRKIDTIILPADIHSFSSYRSDRVVGMPDCYWLKYVDCIEVGLHKGKLPKYILNYFIGRFFNYTGHMNNILGFIFCEQETIPMVKGFTMFEGDYTQIKRKNPEAAKRKASYHLKNKNYFDKDLVFYFKKIIELCHSKGIEVIIVKYPVTRDYYLQASRLILIKRLSQQFDSLIKQYPGITVLNYRKAFFGKDNLFLDSVHLNYHGGTQLSKIIKMRLAETERNKTTFPGAFQ